MSSNVERIKDKLGIVDVVSSYIKITKAGKNYKGRCPFHNEKTPSFFVSPERESFYCFGCGKGGDIFTFVEEFEGLDFLGSMKVLADKAGVKIEFNKDFKDKKEEKDRQYEVLEEATKFYEEKLWQDKKAQDYLKERGLTEETIKLFRLGFVPEGWRNLYEHLKEKGYEDAILKKTGLIGESKGKTYDFLRERIIFPIMDSAGRPVAFTGRVFGNNPSEAKYINSPETNLYNKSKILYGFDKAKFGIRKNDFAIMVEGNMDVIMAHQAGYRNTIAVSGTSLTENHVEIIKRLTSKIVFAFDSDSAGLRASGRGAKIALRKGIDLKVARLKDGKDPADVIKEDPKKWAGFIKDSKHIVDYYLSFFEEEINDERKLALTVKEEVLPYVAMIENKIDQSHFVKKISDRLGVTENAIWQELEKIDLGDVETMSSEDLEKERVEEVSRLEEIKKRIAGLLLWKEETDKDFVTKYQKILKEIVEEDILKEFQDRDKENLIALAEFSFEGSEEIEREINELILNFEEEFLRDKREKVLLQIKKEKDNKKEDLLKEVADISKRIEEIHTKRS